MAFTIGESYSESVVKKLYKNPYPKSFSTLNIAIYGLDS